MRIKKRTNDRGHITSGRRGTGVFWQQWDLSLCFPRESQLGSVTVPAQERSSLKEELSSFPCEQTCTSPAVMAPEVLGVRTSMHPAADCQEGDSFSISQMPRAGLSGTRPPPAKQTPGAQHHGSIGAKSVCCHPSQFNNKPSAGEIFFCDFIQGERLSNPIIDQPGCSLCIFLPYRYVPILKIQARNEVDWLYAEVPSHGMSCLYFQERNYMNQLCTQEDAAYCVLTLHSTGLHWDFCSACAPSVTWTLDKRPQLWALLFRTCQRVRGAFRADLYGPVIRGVRSAKKA